MLLKCVCVYECFKCLFEIIMVRKKTTSSIINICILNINLKYLIKKHIFLIILLECM